MGAVRAQLGAEFDCVWPCRVPLLCWAAMTEEDRSQDLQTPDEETSLEASDLDVPDPEATADPPEADTDEPLGLETASSYAPSAPVITRIRPTRVDTRGGAPVTLFGAGFVPGCRVFVGEEELIGEVVDNFTLRFVAPAGEGRPEVLVESPSGKRSPGMTLEYANGPTILRAVPDEGPTEGGVPIVLVGSGFSEGCAVSLFGTHAPDVVYESPERIRFTLPPAGDGPLDGTITVTLFDGLAGRGESVFRYRPLMPELREIEPSTAWVSGGKLVQALGVDFHPRTKVIVGGREAAVHFRSATHVDFEVPPSDQLGAVDVTIENPDRRSSTRKAGLTYEPVPAPPKIIDVFPRSGLTTGGLTIRIVGDNFTDAVRVRIGEVTAVRRVLSAKLIDADIPTRQLPGKVAIEISLDAINVREEEAFTYESPKAPIIASVEPRSGPTSGLTRVVIEGDNFMKGATVKFDGEASKSVVVKSSQRIEAVTPPAKGAGLVDIEVSAPETGPRVAPKAFRYEAMLAPVITSVSPNRGTTNGGTELTVEGKNFADGCSVLVAGAPVKTKKISGSVLEAYTPEGDDGQLVDVGVKNPDGKSAVQKRAFQFDARYRS